MFTGLIETRGTVVSVEKIRTSALIGIRPEKSGFSPLPGASVAVDGVCLTVERTSGGVHYFTAIAETLGRTTLGELKPSSLVNLEQAMLASARFDGHIVLGHVDGVGTIDVDHHHGTGILRVVRVPENCVPLMAEKGSVAVDGISLTIARVQGDRITLALIPTTLEVTSLSKKREGDRVNIECDVLARYIYRMLNTEKVRDPLDTGNETLLEKMEKAGF
jgi:riboflavin synthase alpha subunit